MSSSRRTIALASLASLVALAVPAIVVGRLSAGELTLPAVLASMSALLASIVGGLRFAAVVGGALVVLSGLAVLAADVPILAALVMAAAALARGYASRWGLQNAALSAAIAVGFLIAQPPPASAGGSLPPAVATALAVLGSGAWTLLVAWLARHSVPRPHRHPVDQQHAVAFAVITAALTGAAAFVVSSAQLAHAGGWFIMTILIVMQPFAKDSFDKSVQRAIGTAVGFVAAFLIGLLLDGSVYESVVAGTLGTLALGGAIVLMLSHKPYWAYASSLTLGIVLLEGSSTSIVDTDVARLVATLAGVGVALAITAVLLPWAKHRPSPRADTASQK